MTILPTLLILAAGSGSRYRASGGQTHKLDAVIDGSSVLQRAVQAAEQSGLAWHVVRAADVPQGSVGMGDSIAAGARATANAAGWLIIPGDLPLVLPATLQRVAHALATGTHDVVTPLFRGRQYPSRSFDTPLRPFQMIPTQLKKQSRSSAPAYSNTPPSLRKTLPPGERTQKIPAGKPVGMFFFAGGPSVT